ncbi:MAG: GIY-YIG nuclease family protein [Gammaproteobacteria bacterium]
MEWFVYIIHCSDESLYTGITNDVSRRLKQHEDLKGAKYFRGRHPKQLVYLEPGHNRSSAAKREFEIKKISRKEKWRIIASDLNKIEALSF